MPNINLQRNSKIFYGDMDFRTEDITAVNPGRLKEIVPLAGLSFARSTNQTDPVIRESGPNPNRAKRPFTTGSNAVTFSWENYVELTGIENAAAPNLNTFPAGQYITASGNVEPLSTHFLYQALVANANPILNGKPNSSWANNGVLITGERKSNTSVVSNVAHVADMRTNTGTLPANMLYYVIDDVIFLLEDATINELVLNGAIDTIATETWSGFATNIDRLTGVAYDRAASVMGGLLSNGTRVEFGANASTDFTEAGKYQAALHHNVNGANADITLINNKLSDMDIYYAPNPGASRDHYSFPITNFTFSYANEITYLTTERLAAYNTPFAPSTGGRAMSMQLTAYLVGGSDNSAQLMSYLFEDENPDNSNRCNVDFYFGGRNNPHLRIYARAAQMFDPEPSIDDAVTALFNIIPQEADAFIGQGNEVEFTANAYAS